MLRVGNVDIELVQPKPQRRQLRASAGDNLDKLGSVAGVLADRSKCLTVC